MLRLLKVLEMAWLAIGVFSIAMGTYHFNQNGLEISKWFFLGALVSGIFYAFRKRQRKKFEAAQKNDKQKEN